MNTADVFKTANDWKVIMHSNMLKDFPKRVWTKGFGIEFQSWGPKFDFYLNMQEKSWVTNVASNKG